MFKPETLEEMAGAASPPSFDDGVGSMLSELSGVYQEVVKPEPAPPAVEEKSDDGSERLLNELRVAVEPAAEPEPAADPVAGKEPEMISPPRIEPPAFFWKPQRRGLFRRK